MIQSVWLVKLPGYAHSEGLRHIAQAFADAKDVPLHATRERPDATPLVFGAHLLEKPRPGTFIYNSEQISDDLFVRLPYYRGILEAAEQVWDYSYVNIAALYKMGIYAKPVPVGYMPSMERKIPEVPKTIDVLFYGSMNSRRHHIMKQLSKKCRTHAAFNLYGDELDAMLARSRIVINIHYYEAAIFEIFRCSYAMANGICVVSETGNDAELERPFQDGVVFSPYDGLVDACLGLLNSPDKIHVSAAAGKRLFSSRTQSEILR